MADITLKTLAGPGGLVDGGGQVVITGPAPLSSTGYPLLATPLTGFKFVNWTKISGPTFITSTDNPLTLTDIPSDLTVQANFTQVVATPQASLFLNVNGVEYDFTADSIADPEYHSTVKVYNLSPMQHLAYDCFITSTNYNSYVWLMTRLNDGLGNLWPKMTFVFDDMFEFDVTGGNPGESFSNPITYQRRSVPGKPYVITPTHSNSGVKKAIQAFSGSSKSSIKQNWNKPHNPMGKIDGYSPSLDQGAITSFMNPNHAGDIDVTKLIRAVFRTVYKREPASSENTYWSSRLFKSLSLGDMLYKLVVLDTSPFDSYGAAGTGEFAINYPDPIINVELFLNSLFLSGIGRAPSLIELRHFQYYADHGYKKSDFVSAVIMSPEFSDYWSLPSSTADDFMLFKVKKNPLVSRDELSEHLRNVIIVIQPSEHMTFSDLYQYAETEALSEVNTGVRYKY